MSSAHTFLHRVLDSDLWYSFIQSPVTVIAALITLLYFIMAFSAPVLAPYTPFDPSSLELMDAEMPPAWMPAGDARFLLGTDTQGRDILSAIMYGSRLSLMVGFSAVLFAVVLGVGLGVVAGYVGGWFEALAMRVADVQLTLPSILVALLVDGIVRGMLEREVMEELAVYVIIFAIGISSWPQYARVTRSVTLVEKNKEYVAAARVIGIHPALIMRRHILPNVMGSVLVIATIGLALGSLCNH